MATATESTAASALPLHHSLVGNREQAGRGPRRAVISPTTGQAFAEVSLLDWEQVSGALDAARGAHPAWSALGYWERGQILLKVRDLLLEDADSVGHLIAREQGKPAAEAQLVEIFPALEALQHLAVHAEDVLRDDPVEAQVLLFAHKDCKLVYESLGVVLAITPWNYPFAISLLSVAGALIAGNTVVLKPAPATTLIGLRLGELFRQAGLPDGVLSVLAVEDALAAALVEDPRVAKIVFTGSVATGKRVMAGAAKNLTPVVLELGGKDPAVVCRDADLDRAAQGIVWGAFVNSGQTCASVERVYVEQAVAEAFVAKVVEETRKLRQGDPSGPEVELGPMTMERQRQIVQDHVGDAVARGAKVLTGGTAPEGGGYFFPPTVLTGVDHTMRIMVEETFGPVLPIMVVASLDEAIRLANQSDYGLTASGWTRGEKNAQRLQKELKAGVVTINDCVYSFGEPTAPWGGIRHSGIGRTHGLAGLREMVSVKYVASDFTRRPNIWWYPYGASLTSFLNTANRALYGRSVFSRVRHQLALMSFPRFWRRANLPSILANLDKLF